MLLIGCIVLLLITALVYGFWVESVQRKNREKYED